MQANESAALDTRCSELHIEQIAEHIEDWKELAPYFNLTEAEEQTILASHAHQPELRKYKMLWKWVKKNGNKATYRKMKEIFVQAGEELLADKLEEILQDAYSQSPLSAVSAFKRYLIDCYSSDGEEGQREWPPLSNAPFVDPELVLENQKVDIRELLQDQNVRKVLLEGTAGSGKTTLTRHICQQWAKDELLCNVDLLIHLTLADPDLWSAHSLEDMIPHPTAEIRKAVADVIVERGGKRCCFVMDGWEDLPENMQQSSFIRTILQGKKPGVALPHCSFIVTSRPIASAFVKPLVTTTVEITGFSAESVDSYATQYLTQKGKDPTIFITALNDNPPTRGLSSIPINAAILLHLFLTIQTGLPTTQTELFRCFLLNLLLRHLRTKAGHHLCMLHDFSSLPEDVKPYFNKLCRIAHYATFSGKAASRSSQLLSSHDLLKAGLQDFKETLGLMKVHQQLTWFGYDTHYGFLHSSVQDFLCAVRMSQLSVKKQVRDFQHIVSSNPTSLILPFYAGMTQLSSEEVCKVLKSIGMKPPNTLLYPKLSVTKSEANDTRRLFLAYLHCLYEANRRDLLARPSSSLQSITLFTDIQFAHYRLSVHDLIVIFAYLLDLVSSPSLVDISFFGCSLGDHAIESAVATFTNLHHTHHQSRSAHLSLQMGANNLTHKGVEAIIPVCDKLVRRLQLGRNLHSPSSSGFIALKLLTEAMSSGAASQLEVLIIGGCCLTSRHAYHLVLLITQAKCLDQLDIAQNLLEESIPLLVSAAKNLRGLDLTYSWIKDKELLEVGLILQSNTNMRELEITSTADYHEAMDSIQSETISRFIEMIVAPASQSCLVRLAIADCYLEKLKCDKIQSALRRFNSRRGFPIKITSYTQTDVGQSLLTLRSVALSIPNELLHGKQCH